MLGDKPQKPLIHAARLGRSEEGNTAHGTEPLSSRLVNIANLLVEDKIKLRIDSV